MDALVVPGQLDSLGAIREYVIRAATAAGFERQAAYRLSLAVDEIATNIITHGYHEAGRAGDITLVANTDDDTLVIHLEDAGMPYNPLLRPLPDDLDAPLEQRRVGGLGIYLAIRAVDKLDYEYVDNKNRHTLVMNRRAGA